MWGANGKNNTRSMGNHWLVALFVLPATLVHAEFMASDSQNLQEIRYVLNGSSTGDSIWALLVHQRATLNSIDSKLTPVSTISSDLSTVKQYLDYNLNGDTVTDSMSVHDFIVKFNQKFFKGVDRFGSAVESNPATVSVFSSNGYSPFIEPDSYFNYRRTAQMAVTNIAETAQLNEILSWLTLISTNVENSYYVPFDPNIFFGGYANNNYPSETQLNSYYSKMANYYVAQHNRNFTQAQTLYKEIMRQFGSWKWQAMQTYLILNPDLLIGSRIATNGMVRTLNTMMDLNNTADGTLMRVYRDSYYDQYATRPLREYFMSFVQDGVTNSTVLANVLSSAGASALVDNATFSNLVSATARSMSLNVNTNDVFVANYGSETNSDAYADIVTNGVDEIEVNKSYAVMADDVSATSLSNKVSMFDFTSKFDDSIKPFIDELEQASGGDWIINFGNVTIGQDFSFTIPALTVERNETFLRFVDKFLNVLKVILTFVFFLTLWRQLCNAVQST